MCREYLVPIHTGIFFWSKIGNTANPMVTQVDCPKIGREYYFKKEYDIRAGTRVDLLNVRDDSKRSNIIKMIIEHQTNASNHSYKMLASDPRFDNTEEVPFPAGGSTRPILVDDVDYRTTFLR